MINNEFLKLLNKSKTVALFSHINADGDAVGSIMAIYRLCKLKNKEVYVFLQEPISTNYNFLGINVVANNGNLPFYDLAICLDCPTSQRFGIYEKEFKKALNSVCIDHHLGNEEFADLNIIEPNKSSTCEIIYDLFENCNLEITPNIATCLYAGLSTDTGSFMHSNTNKSTFVCASKLVEKQADIQAINYNLFVHKNFCEFDIFRKAINSIEFYENGRIAFVAVDKHMLKSANATANDTFLILDFVKGVHNVDIAVLMSESKYREQKVSVRTFKSSAQAICKEFGGGGHFNASGCKIFVPFEKAKQQLLEACRKHLINE